VMGRITAQSTAHPLLSATRLTAAVNASKIGTSPKWISAIDILSRCRFFLRPKRATRVHGTRAYQCAATVMFPLECPQLDWHCN